MLRDVFATWDDWHGELQTVTGYDWEEYEALHGRICADSDLKLTSEDRAMLAAAAGQFFGYPAIKTANLEAAFGDAWEARLGESWSGLQK